MNTKHHRWLLAITLAACALRLPASAAPESASETAIRKDIAGFTAAWNRGDAKAMAAVFAEDADLINPFGRVAKGRSQIEALFVEEHAAVMKGSTYMAAQIDLRMLSPNTTVCDWTSEITGMHDPAGKALPPFRHHVTSLHMMKNGHWTVVLVRAYTLPPPPPAAPAASP